MSFYSYYLENKKRKVWCQVYAELKYGRIPPHMRKKLPIFYISEKVRDWTPKYLK